MGKAFKKILVVDDTEATRYAVARTLKAEGFEILEAANGSEALRMAEDCQPDLMTLDIHLPDIIGFDVCRKIKTNPKTAHIPVLQVSASYVTSKDRIHGLEGGADSYLTHPFEPAVLVATVKALLRSRQLSDDLRESEENFRTLANSIPQLAWIANAKGELIWFNRRWFDYTGKDFEQMQNIDTKDVHHPDHRERVRTKLEKFWKEGGQEAQVWEDIFPLRRADGAYRWFLSRMHPIKDSHGQVVRWFGTSTDIHDQKELNEKLEKTQKDLIRAKELAERANAFKSAFLANMSHEIRTPMSAVLGFAEILKEDGLTADERRDSLERIERSGRTLLRLIDDILDLSKVESGKLTTEKIRISPLEVVEDVVSLLRIQAEQKGLTLTTQKDSQIPQFVYSDSTRIRQILTNLVGNAIKFTQAGEIRVIVKTEIDSEADKEFLILEVIDTGIGISEEDQAGLFQPFAQADASITRQYGGTGLGLALSKRLAQQLGGDLFLAHSQPGQGSHFVMKVEAGPFENFSNQKDFLESAHHKTGFY
jgi:PAS domain S-box-containing protein